MSKDIEDLWGDDDLFDSFYDIDRFNISFIDILMCDIIERVVWVKIEKEQFMNIKKEEENLELLVTSITDEVKNNAIKILEVSKLNLDDLVRKMSNLNDEEKDNVIGKLINNQLIQLKKELSIEQFRKIKKDVEDITEYYINSSDEYDIVEEGDNIADDILFKVLGYNNRNMTLPIDISIIKNYCFSSYIKEEKFYDTLVWIAMRYIAISAAVSYYKWQENYNRENSSN